MRAAASLRPAFLALALLAPAAVRADTSAEQAQSLEQQLHDWLNGLVGTVIDIADRPVHLTPEGDHYRLEIPMAAAAAAAGFDAADATITAAAHPLPGDRWALDDVRIPAALRITGPGAGSDAAIDWSMKIADQRITAVIDPSLATASSFDADIRGQTTMTEGANGAHAGSVGRYVAHAVWLPTGNGRVDVVGNTTGEKLAASQTMPDGSPANLSVERLQSSIRIDGVAADSLGTIVRAAMDMVPIAMSAQHSGRAPAGLPPEARKAARTLVMQLRHLWSGFALDETLESMRIDAAGHGGSIAKLAVGVGAGAREGKLDLHLSLAIDGIDSPDIPAGPLREYLPRHIRLKPWLSGVPIEDATQAALRAIDSDGANGDELTEQATALLRTAPVTVGLDEVELDLGPARLRGGGELRIAAANNISGHAEITVTGLDALIRQASATPELKPGLPVLIMLKGLGRQDGNDTVWKISYSGKKVTVNDNDLSAMLPGSK